MKFRLNLVQAVNNIYSSKLRSILAMIGILVGTASVVSLVSIGELSAKKTLRQFDSLGTDLMSINIYREQFDENNKLTVDDIYQLKKEITKIKSIAPYTSLYYPIKFEGSKMSGNILGITHDLQDILDIKVLSGRFVSFLDKYTYYCVIGNDIYNEIKNKTKKDILGQQIMIGDIIFTIMGVLDTVKENAFFQGNINRAILIPQQTTNIISIFSNISNVIMRLEDNSNIEGIKNNINSYIDGLPGDYNANIQSASQILDRMQEASKTFTLMLGLIGSVALIVGGIGVMNVMLVSVVERKREIGIRMAIGAKRKDIRLLFLIESIILSISGGVIGIALGLVISFVVSTMYNMDFIILVGPTVLGFLVSVLTGIFFGFYPAHRASKLNPIETLRYE